MTLTGNMLIGQQAIRGTRAAIRGINPATDLPMEPAYPGGSGEHVEQACALAAAAFDDYRETSLAARALQHGNPLTLRRLLDGQREA